MNSALAFLAGLAAGASVMFYLAKPVDDGRFTRRYLAPHVDLELTTFRDVAFPAITEQCLAAIGNMSGARVFDIGTGNGAFALWAVKNRGAAFAVGSDVSASAIENAAFNAVRLDVQSKVEFRKVSLDDAGAFAPIKTGEKFDLIYSNPPFYNQPAGDMESRIFTDPGFILLRSIMENYPRYLAPGGRVILRLGTRAIIQETFKMAARLNRKIRIFCPLAAASYEELSAKISGEFEFFRIFVELTAE